MRLNRKHIISIVTVIAGAIGLVTILAWVAMKPIAQKSNFKRNFLTQKLIIENVIEKEDIITGIAGATKYNLFFKTKHPDKIFQSDHYLKNLQYKNIYVPTNPKIASGFNCVVDSPNVIIMAGNGPAITKADINNKSSLTYKFPNSIFSRSVMIKTNSYIFRGFDTTMKGSGQIFIKGNLSNGELLRNENIIKNNSDKVGLITDGHLNYDKKTNRLTYVSYYSNQILCLDTNLNLIYRSHTIDTLNSSQIKTGLLNKSYLTYTTPARVINSKSHTFEGKLYNISKLKADNEDHKVFSNNAVVDIYDIQNGFYEKSIYIPLYKKDKLIDFKILKDKIVVVYKKHIVMYHSLH